MYAASTNYICILNICLSIQILEQICMNRNMGNEPFTNSKVQFSASKFSSLDEMLCPNFPSKLPFLTIGDSYSGAQSVLSWNDASFIDVI